MVLSSDDIKQLTALLRENEQPVWPGTPELGQCFVRMGQLIELSQTSPLPTSRLALLVNEVFVCLLELLRVQNPPRKVSLTSGERSVAMFLDQLRHELYEPWTLELMAERVGIARTRFAYHCRRLTNLSPMGYLQHLRLEKAKQMLVGERHSITMIALECGFSSGAYFSSVFRKHNQCSPRDYRDTAGDHPSKPLSRPSRHARIDPAR